MVKQIVAAAVIFLLLVGLGLTEMFVVRDNFSALEKEFTEMAVKIQEETLTEEEYNLIWEDWKKTAGNGGVFSQPHRFRRNGFPHGGVPRLYKTRQLSGRGGAGRRPHRTGETHSSSAHTYTRAYIVKRQKAAPPIISSGWESSERRQARNTARRRPES